MFGTVTSLLLVQLGNKVGVLERPRSQLTTQAMYGTPNTVALSISRDEGVVSRGHHLHDHFMISVIKRRHLGTNNLQIR